MRRELFAASISASSANSSSLSASGAMTGSRRRALETSRTVGSNAARICGGLGPATERVDILAGFEHARDAPFDHSLDRGLAGEQRRGVDEPGPAIGHVVGKQKVQAF